MQVIASEGGRAVAGLPANEGSGLVHALPTGLVESRTDRQRSKKDAQGQQGQGTDTNIGIGPEARSAPNRNTQA